VPSGSLRAMRSLLKVMNVLKPLSIELSTVQQNHCILGRVIQTAPPCGAVARSKAAHGFGSSGPPHAAPRDEAVDAVRHDEQGRAAESAGSAAEGNAKKNLSKAAPLAPPRCEARHDRQTKSAHRHGVSGGGGVRRPCVRDGEGRSKKESPRKDGGFRLGPAFIGKAG
jgi:hypothetical protein